MQEYVNIYVNINEKHIIMQNDFETIEDLIKRVKIVLENGEKKFENSEKIQIDNGKYRLILDKSISGNISVLTIFNFFVNDYHKQRSSEEQEKKRKELIFADPNSFTQEGTPSVKHKMQ